MAPLARLHWSTLGDDTGGLEHRWAAFWDVTVDRSAQPALAPREVDLWVISVKSALPPPELNRMMAEVGALPILLALKPDAPALAPKALGDWGGLGSVRWGVLGPEPPMPGLRPRSSPTTQLSASQALAFGLVGASTAMQDVLARARSAAATRATVLLLGESGTGKELLGEALHSLSPRSAGPLVRVNCAAIPESLIEAELFGVERGAYTGAERSRPGYLEFAHGGTLFLDEIGELSQAVQAKLLRVLGERSSTRVGGTSPYELNFRLLCATNRDLPAMIAAGEFREDLYYRINVISLQIPPLRERREDIPLLAAHFIERFSSDPGKKIRMTPEVLERLMLLPWPGNVRELSNLIEQLSLLYPGQQIHQRHLPPSPANGQPLGTIFEKITVGIPLKEAITEFERHYIDRVLSSTGGRKSRAAEILGVSRKSLWEKLREESA